MKQHTHKPNHPIAWHSKSVKDCLHILQTTLTGLSQAEADKRRKKYGVNTLPSPPKRSLLIRLLMQFNHLLIYILLVAACITIIFHHLVDTVVIIPKPIENPMPFLI